MDIVVPLILALILLIPALLLYLITTGAKGLPYFLAEILRKILNSPKDKK